MSGNQKVASDELIEHYRSHFRQHGASHRAVLWSSENAQRSRFRVLCDVVEAQDSVVDVGCGIGDMLSYLRTERGFRGRYLGLDFVPDFIAHCRDHHVQDELARFELFDAHGDPFPHGFDCFLVCGTFNNLMSTAQENVEWMCRTVENMFAVANKAVAFNSLSSYVERHEADLFYTRPPEMVEWCAKRLTRKLSLRHDYNVSTDVGLPLDYTLYLFKENEA